MYIYDKHDHSVRACIGALVKKIKLSPARTRPVFLEIGSGFHARFTGDLLHWLFRGAVRGMDPWNVEFHLVDPALYGYYSQIALLALEPAFGKIDVRTHAEMWTSAFSRTFRIPPNETLFDAAFTLETTTLMPPGAFRSLHHDLRRLLVPGGFFLDVSEEMDRATSTIYQGLKIYPRKKKRRIDVAGAAGFKLVGQRVMPAHATAIPDSQLMTGLLFRSPG